MKISVRVSLDGIKRKVARARGAISAEAEKALRALAAEAIDLIEQAPAAERRHSIERALTRQFQSVFIPVHLQHLRKERWPDLLAIFRARVIHHERTYRGRKLFWVDEIKEQALFDAMLAKALARHRVAEYEVRFIKAYRSYRVEIIRRGGSGGDDEVMIAYAKKRMKVVAADTIAQALQTAGFAPPSRGANHR